LQYKWSHRFKTRRTY